MADDYAYLGNGRAMQILNISNPDEPLLVGQALTSSYIWDIHILRHYAYVSSFQSGFYIFDISNPKAPVQLSLFDTSESTFGLFVQNNIAYVTSGYIGLFIIDVSTPAEPREIGFLPLQRSARDVYVDNKYAFVADGPSGIYILRNDSITGINAKSNSVLEQFSLKQNFPNPFNPKTQIVNNLPTPSYVTLKIYNTQGQEIRSLVNGFQFPGKKQVIWNGLDHFGKKVTSGVFIYKIEGDDFSLAKKMILVR